MTQETKANSEKAEAMHTTAAVVHRIPFAAHAAIERVLAYLWEPEFEDFLNCGPAAARGHILPSLAELREYLDRSERVMEIKRGDTANIESNVQWGRCPQCGHSDGFRNVGRAHWFYCEAHHVKWCAGENLFSAWRMETDADWKENSAFLRDFTEVEPDPE